MAFWKKQKLKLSISLLVAAVAAVMATGYRFQQRPERRAAALAPAMSFGNPSNDRPATKERAPKIAANSRSNPTVSTNLRQRLKTAEDWYAFAKDILPLAQAGDPEAQYVLFQVIGACEDGVNSVGAKSESLAAARSEGLRLFPSAPELVSKYEAGYIRCHGFYADHAVNLGSSTEWLRKSTDAGYPAAQGATAVQRLQQEMLKASVKAGGAGGYTTDLAPIGGDANPRELLVAAAQSGDPDVFTQIASMQRILNPDQPREVIALNSTAWKYLACQRGADCSEYGPATLTNCRPNDSNCTPVPDIFMKMFNYNWAPVQDRVDQINAALNDKQWDQLPGLAAGR